MRWSILVCTLAGEYVSFIDDDDIPEDCYVSEVMSALAQSPDVVGFTTRMTGGWSSFFSLANMGMTPQQGGNFYRTVSCFSPIRTSLARKGSYIAKGKYEDEAFASSLAPHLEGAREARITRPILTYTGAHADSCQTGGPGVPIGPLTGRRGPEERPEVASPAFRWFEGAVTPAHALPVIRPPVIYRPD